jgi:hypothetical protein
VKKFNKTTDKIRTWQEILLKGRKAFQKEMQKQAEKAVTLVSTVLPEIRVQKRKSNVFNIQERIDESALSFFFIESIDIAIESGGEGV